jgi:hypothetical protein
MQQLQNKHPYAEPPALATPTAMSPPLVQVTADAFREVLQSKLPRGSAAGPSGGLFQQLRSALLTDANAFEGGLWFVNAQLAGTLPYCEHGVVPD